VNFLVFGAPGRIPTLGFTPAPYNLQTQTEQPPSPNPAGMPSIYYGTGRLDGIADGTTQTVLFSEKLSLCTSSPRPGASYWSFPPCWVPANSTKPRNVNCSSSLGFKPGYEERCGATGAQQPTNAPLYNFSAEVPGNLPFQVQPVPTQADDYGASTMHSGGINVVMGDASVRFVGQNITRDTWRAILSPNSGFPADRPGTEWIN
jgi:hypothetical protein